MAILTITRGGGLGATTDLAAGVRLGDTATAAIPVRTYTAVGAIPLTRVPGPLGRIPTQETMVRQAEPLSKTLNGVAWVSLAAARMPTSTPATPSPRVGPWAMIRRQALWLGALPDTRAICTP